MRRLPLVLLAVAVPAFAEGEEVDAGAPAVLEADAGTPTPAPVDAGVFELEVPPGVGRHFAFVWDAEGPAHGETDVQLWVTPRWGRPESYLAADLRAGAMQGLSRGFALGFFVDVTPMQTGPNQDPAIDGRLTVHLGKSFELGPARLGGRVEVSGGAKGFSTYGVLAADAQLGAFRVGFNADAWTDAAFDGGARLDKTRVRQTLGLSYTLTDGVSAGLEVQNRLTWSQSAYRGDAFLIGPSVAYRGKWWWFSIALLPEVAAMKAPDQVGVGDPLELTDNERFTLRVALGVTVH